MSQEEGSGSFLSRWSRRKAQVQQGGSAVSSTGLPSTAEAAPSTAVPSVAAPQRAAMGGLGAVPAKDAQPEALASASAAVAPAMDADSASVATPTVQAPPRPTLEDVEQLNAQSDYRNFVARDVDPEVRNAAFKKLFHSDPHFNVMDGLDVYIDDYNTPNPLPVAIMKTLVQARAMGLIDDELKEQEPPAPDVATDAAAPAVAEPTAGEAPTGDAGLGETAPGSEADQLTDTPLGTGEAVAQADTAVGYEAQPALVELVMVPDTASNDEPIKALPTVATAAGTVVPFPRRPGSADPA